MNRVKTFRPGKPSRAASLVDAKRRADLRFLNSAPWVKLREAYKLANPLCHDCEARGRVTPACHVHHVKRREDRPDLALEWSNLMGLCRSCHSRKTARGE